MGRGWLMGCGVAALLLAAACQASGPGGSGASLRIMSWNAQNLFDDQSEGGEYPEFVPVADDAAQGWTRAAYRERLERCGRVIRETASLPDIVVLYEIESLKVLDDLRADFLPIGAYPFAYLQHDPGSSIHIAVLSRLPLTAMRSHAYSLDGASARPIWELSLALPGKPGTPLVLLANHWKSKSGGEAATEALRILAAGCLDRAAAQARLDEPGALVLACGDFNETLVPLPSADGDGQAAKVKVSRTIGGRPFRLAAARQGQRAWSTGETSALRLASGKLDWFSAWVTRPLPEATMAPADSGPLQPPGSYFYDGQWETIDHFLVPGVSKWPENLVFKVPTSDFQLDAKGFPLRYDSRTGKGISDHLPLLLEITAATTASGAS